MLRARRPDIVALQEVFPETAPRFREALHSLGLRYCLDSFANLQQPERLKGKRRYGVLIASRWQLRRTKQVQVPWPESALCATVSSPCGDIEIHTVHVPPGASNGWIKIRTLEALYKRLARAATHPRILCGDFNTPQFETPDGQVVSWAQRLMTNGEVVYERWPGAKRWDAAERNILEGLVKYGLVDAFRYLHGYRRPAFSWRQMRNGKRHSRRYDHTFAARELRALQCKYMQGPRRRGLSDHAPIEVEFRRVLKSVNVR